MILVEPPLSNIGKRERRIVEVKHKVRICSQPSGMPQEVHFYVGDYKDAKSSAVLTRQLGSWALSCVGTKPEFQRQGLSRQVINAVKAYVMLNSSLQRVKLDTTSEVARALYESEGFKLYNAQPKLEYDNQRCRWIIAGTIWYMAYTIKERDLT